MQPFYQRDCIVGGVGGPHVISTHVLEYEILLQGHGHDSILIAGISGIAYMCTPVILLYLSIHPMDLMTSAPALI